jgi:hypothetical protein
MLSMFHDLAYPSAERRVDWTTIPLSATLLVKVSLDPLSTVKLL